MKRVKFDAVVKRANTKEDRFHTTLLYYVGGEHINPKDPVVHNRGLIAGSTIGPMFYFGFKKGQILFVSRNPHLRKCAQADFDGICSEKTFVLETKDDNVLLQRYLVWVMQRDGFWNYCEDNKSGSINFFINWSTLAEYEFELPDIEEQKRIADLLWAAYDLKESYIRLLAASDEMAKSRFIEMFGEPGTDLFGWGITTLGKCCELNPRRPKNIRTDISYSFVAMPSVDNNGHVDASITRPYSEVCKGFTYFAENDVLFAKITPCMENGKGGIAKGLLNGVGFGSTEFHVLRPIDGISDPYWLYTVTMLRKFRTDAEKVMTGTGGQRRVPINYLNDYKIALPPLSLQNEFAAFIEHLDKSKVELQKCIDALDVIIRGLLNDSFRG